MPDREVLAVAATVVAIVEMALEVASAGGGRDDAAVRSGLLWLLPALVLSRPWTRLPVAVCALASLPALGAAYVCVVSPTGWAGAEDLAVVGYCGALFLAVAASATTARRRTGLVVALVAVTALQAADGLWIWVVTGDATKPATGSFFWHNPFAAYVAAGVLVATAYALRGPLRRRCGAVLATALGWTAVVASSSRASLVLLLLGSLVLAGTAVRDTRAPRLVLGRALVLVAAVLVTGLSLTGPLVMGDSGSPVSAVAARHSTESFKGSGSTRLDFFAAAARVAVDSPVTGAGFTGQLGAATLHQGPLELRAKNVHNGVLQAAAEGGVPLVLAYSVPLLLGAVGLIRRGRACSGSADGVLVPGVLVATGFLLAHSLVDFDWTFPAVPALTAALLGVGLAVPRTSIATGVRRASRPAALVLCLALVVVSLAAAVRADVAEPAARADVLPRGPALLTGVGGPFPDPRTDRTVLRQAAAGQDVPADRLRLALTGTARWAERDVPLQWLRTTALLQLGERDAGLRLAERTWAQHAYAVPLQVIGYAGVLDAAGLPDRATAALDQQGRRLLDAGPAGHNRAQTILLASVRRGGPAAVPASVRCELAAVPRPDPALGLPEQLAPTTPCPSAGSQDS